MKNIEEPFKSDVVLAKKIKRKVKELQDLINSSDKFSVQISATGRLRKSGIIETRPGHHITLRVGRELGSLVNESIQ